MLKYGRSERLTKIKVSEAITTHLASRLTEAKAIVHTGRSTYLKEQRVFLFT